MSRVFPDGFLWGVATAAYQVEGAAEQDGRAPSVWDSFSHTPGMIKNEHNGDTACDQYNRYAEDVALIKKMGLGAYRFSVSWSRIMPSGRGEVNEKGIDYYRRLVDRLLNAGVQPWMTLFHWDLPQAMQDDLGGWQSRETSRYFADYCRLMASRFGDTVQNFMTINEFSCFTDSGYYPSGQVFAPGIMLDTKGRNQVRHNALLAHGLGVQAIRSVSSSARVGLAENPVICVPVMETEEHIQAAKIAFREENAHFLTAVLEGKYPDSYLRSQGRDAPEFTGDDMNAIGSPLDFVGVNLYLAKHVMANSEADSGYSIVKHPPSYPHMHASWIKVSPEICYWAPRYISELWGVKEVYITENGCACDDTVDKYGRINDTDRVFYLRNHLLAAHRAATEGVPLKGYFCWSLLDNFEWADGYTYRFGIVHVDFCTLERTPKLSADYYSRVAAANTVL